MHAIHSHTDTHTEAEFTRTHVPTYVCMPVCKSYTTSLSYIVLKLYGNWLIVCYRHHKHRHTFIYTQTHTDTERQKDRQTHKYVCTYVRRYRQETAPVCMNAVYCIVWHTRKNKECTQSILTQIHTQRQREIVCHCLATVHTDMPSYTHVSRYRQEAAPVCMNAVYCIVWRMY